MSDLTQTPASPQNSPQPAAPIVPPRKKSVIYVDGFNLYYGLLHERPDLKWLNLQRLAELLRPDDDILKVRFFTAELDAKKEKSEKRDRQKRIWRALATQQKIQFTYGKFADRTRDCLVHACPHKSSFHVLEEKQTDVNIALAMVRDLTVLQTQVLVLITGDTDQLPSLEEALRLKPDLKVVVYNPVPEEKLRFRRSDEFGRFATTVKPIPEKYLRMAQFPNKVEDGKGGYIERPAAWKVA